MNLASRLPVVMYMLGMSYYVQRCWSSCNACHIIVDDVDPLAGLVAASMPGQADAYIEMSERFLLKMGKCEHCVTLLMQLCVQHVSYDQKKPEAKQGLSTVTTQLLQQAARQGSLTTARLCVSS